MLPYKLSTRRKIINRSIQGYSARGRQPWRDPVARDNVWSASSRPKNIGSAAASLACAEMGNRARSARTGWKVDIGHWRHAIRRDRPAAGSARHVHAGVGCVCGFASRHRAGIARVRRVQRAMYVGLRRARGIVRVIRPSRSVENQFQNIVFGIISDTHKARLLARAKNRFRPSSRQPVTLVYQLAQYGPSPK